MRRAADRISGGTVGDRDRRAVITVVIAIMTTAALVLTSCTIGPSRRPDLAISGGNTTASTPTSHRQPMPLGPGGKGRTAQPLAWDDCPATIPRTAPGGTTFAVRCATLMVPTSYPEPNRGSIELHVAEARAAETPPAAPPLVVMLGDPGAVGEASIAATAASLPADIRAHYTIVAMDPRGTGESTPINCVSAGTARAILGMAADPASPRGTAQLTSITRQLAFDCGDTAGPALTKINSTNAADDLDSLRSALRVDRLSILARGGGATIGAVYADRYPGRVTAMILDSPADPTQTPQDRAAATAIAAQTLLRDFAAACTARADGCPLGDDPVAAITALVDRFATSGTDAGPWVVTAGSVLLSLIELLPDPTAWPSLADALAGLGDGNARPLADLVTGALGGADLTARLSARIIYDCNDTTDRLDLRDMAGAVAPARTAAPLFGPYAVALSGLCASWPAPDEALGRLSGAGAPPITVIGSVNDPVHPFAAARSVAGQLASATLVTWQSGHDGAYPASVCITSIVDDYLLHGKVPDRGTLCPP